MPEKRKTEREHDAVLPKKHQKRPEIELRGRNDTRATAQEQAEDTAHSVLGGLKGGFRVTGDEEDIHPGVKTFKIPFGDKQIICEQRGDAGGSSNSNRNGKPKMKKGDRRHSLQTALIFTHGAGGGISNPATASFAEGFSKVDPIICFQGTMNLQSRVKTFHAVVEHLKWGAALGGRSMGARAAVITALESEPHGVTALVLASYPLVGAGKGDVRDGILLDLGDEVDVLFVIGGKDSTCDIDRLNEVRQNMTAKSWLVEVNGADHGMSMKNKKAMESVRQKTGIISAEWLKMRDPNTTYCSVSWEDSINQVIVSKWSDEKERSR